ncbi:MAG: flippase [Actinomycetota bacterium]
MESHPSPPPDELDPGEGASEGRLAANAGWLLVAEVAGKLANFALFVIIARGLGTRQYGYFTFALSFIALFLMFGRLGLQPMAVKEISRNKNRLSELFASGLILRTVLAVTGLGLAFAVAPFIVHGRQALLAVLVVGSALLLDELSTFLASVFQAFEQMRFDALITLANRILSAVLAGIALGLGAGLVTIAATYLAGSLGALLCGWYVLHTRFPPIALKDARRAIARDYLIKGLPLGLAALFNVAVFRLDAVMLEAIKGPLQVAQYGVAYRFFESILFVAWALSTAALPRIARGDDGRTYGYTSTTLAAFYLPFAVGAPFAARGVIQTVFSWRYAAAGSAVGWLTAAALFYAFAYFTRVCLMMRDRGRVVLLASGATVVLNIGLNAALIPHFGFEGAAATTFVSEVFEAIVLVALYVRVTQVKLSVAVVVPLTGAGAMAGVLLASGLRGWAAAGVGAAVYLAALGIGALLLGRERLSPLLGPAGMKIGR